MTDLTDLTGTIFTVRNNVCRITGEPQVLAGLRVEVIGAGGMVGHLAVRLVDIEQVAAVLAKRDAWWTVERVEEIAGEVIEFDREDLV